MKTGNLIVIEGSCDGVGKTTQFKKLIEHLKEDGETIITHHFPSYQTKEASLVEEYLKGNYGNPNDLSPYFINSLYAIDRAITWNQKLKKEYQKNKTIVLDRYTTSSLIYQSALMDDINKKKDFINYICDFEYKKLGIKEPNNVIFLHAPFQLINQIRNKREQNEGIEKDIHESNIEYMKKVYENAMFVADYLNWNHISCSHNNKMRKIEDIHKDVYKLVRKK